MQHGRADGVDGSLSQIEVLDRLSPVEQEFEEALLVVVGRRAETNVERHPPSCLRLASSFACNLANTSSADSDSPVAR
jgi:hypothetical protein